MKKKFRLWLNIVTICLCVCAIAIGVYAATSASLTVQGQIGFTAHGCDIDASGYIYGHASGETLEAMKNGAPVAPPAQDGTGKVMLTQTSETTGYTTPNVAELRGANGGLDLGDRLFTDMNSNEDGKPTDIVVVLTLTNQSLFDIYGVVSATSTKGNIGIKKSVGLFNLGKKVGTTTKSIDVEITLSVYPDATGAYNDITDLTSDNVHISIDFNKGNVSDLIKTEKVNETTTNYYLEMGTVYGTANGTPLRWYAFAKDDAGHSKSTALTSGSYYFISEKALLMTGQDAGKAFNTNGYQETATHYGVDYAHESTIQPLVNGQDDGSVYATYGMSSSPIYKAITNRDLEGETYTHYQYDENFESRSETPYTTRTAYNQTLWLLSKAEVENTAYFADDDAKKVLPVSEISADSTSYANWWLRSPFNAASNGFAFAWSVNESGTVNDDFDVTVSVLGVRPAFQIDIAV